MSNTKRTLATLLGLREKTEQVFKNMLKDMVNKFKKNQGLFLGDKRTYEPLDDYADVPSKRGYKAVQSTVNEQLEYLKDHTLDYLNVVFGIEKTNAEGNVKAELIVEGVSWGEYSSLELLRLKSLLEKSSIKEIYANLPIREQTKIWKKSDNPDYEGKNIYETRLEEGMSTTTLKRTFIMNDPHADKGNRAPMTAESSTQVNIGKYTSQEFSGELSIAEKARMISRLDKMHTAVIEALQNANAVEVKESDLGSKLFDYINS